ncbi:MAG: MltA domain-containing protein [Methylophilaceae bacterium]|nr:MltA domain-containing protein [Methylophilaceae bacterium]MBL6728009.1 MltA domain-containing protein [Methylophilaceae bacterium]MBL6791637.1 MltA domain-containing protein [Methylophilaceae bacterium]
MNRSLIILLALALNSCGQLNLEMTDCECETEPLVVAKEEAEKCEAYPEEPVVEKDIVPYSTLVQVDWTEITPMLDKDYLSLSWTAWLRGCQALINRDDWEDVCLKASSLSSPSDDEVKDYFYTNFNLYQAKQSDDSTEGLVTGYYQPVLEGSRVKTKKFRIPLYAPPSDLITVDLSEVYPDLRYMRLRGRVEGDKLVPYLTREEIAKQGYPLQGNELLWVKDPVEAFFLEIQGSGVIAFEDGERIQVGYANQNGHPYRSMGRALIQEGELSRHKVSMQSIKAWAKKNPKKLQKFLNANPSVVFFRELEPGLPGPIGALGIPITAERSVAVDRKYIPLGAPIFLSTTWPNSSKPLNQLMMAQDTGGAIGGGVRVDFYWGQGDKAGQQAGRMKQDGKVWVLLPKTFKLKKGD